MANAYDELAEELKDLLEGDSAFASSYLLKDIAARYEVSATRVRRDEP